MSAVRDCLFNIVAATLHIGSRSSIRNLRTRHAMVTGTHLSRMIVFPIGNFVIILRNLFRMIHNLILRDPAVWP